MRWLSRVIGHLEQTPIPDADLVRADVVMMACKLDHHPLATQRFEFPGAQAAVIDVGGALAPQRQAEFHHGAGDRTSEYPQAGVPLADIMEERRPDQIEAVRGETVNPAGRSVGMSLIGDRLFAEEASFLG